MYIEPSTIIKFYKNIPIDSNYNNTLKFTSITAQQDYFHTPSTNLIATLTAQSYQRHSLGRIRVQLKTEDLFACNYIAFQNSNFGAKWFYGFVTKVEYVNNNVSEIEYSIDVMQTYMFDVTVKECFVEREHSETDNVGDNIIGENMNIGDYRYSEPLKHFYERWTMVIQHVNSNIDKQYGQLNQYGIYSGLNTWIMVNYPLNIDEIKTALDTIRNSGNKVVNIYMCPMEFIETEYPHQLINIGDMGTCGNSIDGYIPRNKKLLTYPYNMLNVWTSDFNEKDYKYEFGYYNEEYEEDGQRKTRRVNGLDLFLVSMDVQQEVTCYITPQGYDNQYDSINNALFLENFPLCSWGENTYLDYKVRNSQRLAINGLLGIVGNVASPLTIGSGIGVGIGAINSAINIGHTVNEVESMKYQPKDIKGNTSNGNLLAKYHNIGFVFRRKYINNQTAKVIDDYFDKFGYATKLVKVPNIFNSSVSIRPHWNYLKTQEAIIVGSAPADDIKKMCSILDNGITFWNNASEVGNYSLNNAPV